MKKADVFTDEECYFLDILSITRTRLSNERTLLAYINTSLAFLATGAALIKLVNERSFLILGYLLLFSSIVIIAIGIYRFIKFRQIINTKICVQNNEHKCHLQ